MKFHFVFNNNLEQSKCPPTETDDFCSVVSNERSAYEEKLHPCSMDGGDCTLSRSSDTVSSSTIGDDYYDDDSSLESNDDEEIFFETHSLGSPLSCSNESNFTSKTEISVHSTSDRLHQATDDLSTEEVYQCLSSIRQQFGDDHPLTAQMWNFTGLRYFTQSDYENAILCFQYAVYCCHSKLCIELAHAYAHLGRCYRRCERKEEAFDFYVRAAESYEFFAAFDAKDRTFELGLIDDEIRQLAQSS